MQGGKCMEYFTSSSIRSREFTRNFAAQLDSMPVGEGCYGKFSRATGLFYIGYGQVGQFSRVRSATYFLGHFSRRKGSVSGLLTHCVPGLAMGLAWLFASLVMAILLAANLPDGGMGFCILFWPLFYLLPLPVLALRAYFDHHRPDYEATILQAVDDLVKPAD